MESEKLWEGKRSLFDSLDIAAALKFQTFPLSHEFLIAQIFAQWESSAIESLNLSVTSFLSFH